MPKYSLIIPVYNRPQEVDELLESLKSQSIEDFEVVVVEDGSKDDCKSIVEGYKDDFNLLYYKIANSGPGTARNFGAGKASGEWFIFLDSDTLIPEGYLESINDFIQSDSVDAFGGADRDRDDFLPIQKAISYSMTSFLTTGGIRGSKKSLEKFKPRSFNMGIKKLVFEKLGGFGKMRYGEDIDFSLRIEKANFKTAYIAGAFVYHKRRTSFGAFFRQIKHSGEARILLSKLHKGSFKLVHLFPGLFTVGILLSVLLVIFGLYLGMIGIALYSFYFLIIGFHSSVKSGSLDVGILSVIASFVQLTAYGYGFFKAGTISLIRG